MDDDGKRFITDPTDPRLVAFRDITDRLEKDAALGTDGRLAYQILINAAGYILAKYSGDVIGMCDQAGPLLFEAATRARAMNIAIQRDADASGKPN